ncbi:MAG: hypothetical protein J0L70_28675 [Leptolyngbya sp. UWPOB_LEPTO1]|uniref:hypothetical protein n=1 Tax=Leptolyngbya sp. UWPOB_LEPTO1 TaxID=2815653 RepID=UPI001AC0FD44|nr:hypothetical protein [Leptolyngbya sp. UWPOB_LEPTO1]MBN8564511.1 hypothetical protein [Leptolyngbya sp. UWPOB_LEPTO1]
MTTISTSDAIDLYMLRVSKAMQPRTLKRVCANCREYDRGVCKLRASADWENDSFVKAERSACSFAVLRPF